MEHEEGHCMYCNGRFVGRGNTADEAYQHMNQQLLDHEDMCLMRYASDKKSKKRR